MNSYAYSVSRRDSDGDWVVPGDLRVGRDVDVKGDLTIKGGLRYPTWEERFKKLEETVEALVVAQNESREQIQALLDYCFTDRSQWKEGASISSSDKITLSSSVSKEEKKGNEEISNEIESNV